MGNHRTDLTTGQDHAVDGEIIGGPGAWIQTGVRATAAVDQTLPTIEPRFPVVELVFKAMIKYM